MRDACIMSASADMRVSPKKSLSSEKTRSAAAEFGVKEKTIRIPLRIKFGHRIWIPNLNYLEVFGSIWFSPKPKVFGTELRRYIKYDVTRYSIDTSALQRKSRYSLLHQGLPDLGAAFAPRCAGAGRSECCKTC